MRNPLRSLLEEPRPAGAPGPGRLDVVLVAAIAVGGALEGLLRDALPWPVPAILMAVGLGALLPWRRTRPLAVVAAVFGSVILVDAVLLLADVEPLDTYTMLYVLLLPYALCRWGSGREVVAGVPLMLLASVLATVVAWTGPGDAFGGLGVLLASLALGWAVRSQHGARERLLAQVKAQERVLLARELHDTVAHHVSAIAVHAQAGRVLAASDPGAPVEALQVIEVEATRTLAEMRAMVRVLRNAEPADYAPQSGVADLPRLAGSRAAGPRVEVTVSGDVAALPAAIDAAVYRIAQEAVTNALRHARNATLVEVAVAGEEASVSVVVRDDGEPGDLGGAGFGLTGMVERASLLGGHCHAGPRAGRGWAVSATLPRAVPA